MFEPDLMAERYLDFSVEYLSWACMQTVGKDYPLGFLSNGWEF